MCVKGKNPLLSQPLEVQDVKCKVNPGKSGLSIWRARMRKRFDRLTPAEYSIDDGNKAFTINNLGNADSVNVQR
jgi:hypothetical protein